jgi:hypothetical protein
MEEISLLRVQQGRRVVRAGGRRAGFLTISAADKSSASLYTARTRG